MVSYLFADYVAVSGAQLLSEVPRSPMKLLSKCTMLAQELDCIIFLAKLNNCNLCLLTCGPRDNICALHLRRVMYVELISHTKARCCP